MVISCTDTILRDQEGTFVNAAFDKFTDLNSQVGFTDKTYSFPSVQIMGAYRNYIVAKKYPDRVFAHLTFDWVMNRVDAFAGEVLEQIGSVEKVKSPELIFSGKFLL